ncbi:MAG: diadenylate cyclase [Planctomycetes bacterium]|nr:diadenylate cyclase [Planctomycetota bacterium]
MHFLNEFRNPVTAIEVAVLWAAIYAGLRFLRSTRGFGLLRGLAGFFLAAFVLYQILLGTDSAPVIQEILSSIAPSLVVLIIVLFQPELRQGLARIGGSGWLSLFRRNDEDVNETVSAVVGAARHMAQERTGALLAFERGVPLAPYRDNAVPLDSLCSSILLETIFFPGSPLHDGAVILQSGKITAASALFPLTTNPEVQRRMGTRHRAAIGLTEETDAITLVVSEETGRVSLASNGRLFEAIPLKELEARLIELLREEPADAEAEESEEVPVPVVAETSPESEPPSSNSSSAA